MNPLGHLEEEKSLHRKFYSRSFTTVFNNVLDERIKLMSSDGSNAPEIQTQIIPGRELAQKPLASIEVVDAKISKHYLCVQCSFKRWINMTLLLKNQFFIHSSMQVKKTIDCQAYYAQISLHGRPEKGNFPE